MKRYEYRVEDEPSDEYLTALGAEGWRAVSVLWRDSGHLYGQMDRVLLEREVADPLEGGMP